MLSDVSYNRDPLSSLPLKELEVLFLWVHTAVLTKVHSSDVWAFFTGAMSSSSCDLLLDDEDIGLWFSFPLF